MRAYNTVARINTSLIRLYQLIRSDQPNGSISYHVTSDLLGTVESTDDPDMQLLARGESNFNIQLRHNVKLFNPFSISDRSQFIYGGIQSKMPMNSIVIVRAGPNLYDYFRDIKSGATVRTSAIEEFYMISLSREQLKNEQIMDMIITYFSKIMLITNNCITYETTTEYIDAIIEPTERSINDNSYELMRHRTESNGINRRRFRFHLKIFDSITTLMMMFELPYHQIATVYNDRVICTNAAKKSIDNNSISGVYSRQAIEQARLDGFDISNTTVGNDWNQLYKLNDLVVNYYDDYNPNLIALINRLTPNNLDQLVRIMTNEVSSINEEYNIQLIPYYYGLITSKLISGKSYIGVSDMIEWLIEFIRIITEDRRQLLATNIFDYRWYNIAYYNHKYVYNWRLQQG